MLRTFALGIEREELKDIFLRGEIEEKTYKKITNMLSIQTERIKRGQQQVSSVNEHFPIDSLEKFVLWVTRIAFWRKHVVPAAELYCYYRALIKISGKVVKELKAVEDSSLSEVFDDKTALDKLLALYQDIQANAMEKMQAVIHENSELLTQLNETTANQSLAVVKKDTLDKLHKNEIITSKLYIMLRHELEESKR